MTLQIADRVKETTTTTGTGAITLAGAMTGFRALSAVCSNAATIYYALQEVDGNGNPTGAWETGLGTYTSSGNTLTRTTILASSNSGSAITLSGTTQVWGDLPAGVMKNIVQPIAFAATNTSAQSIPNGAYATATGWTNTKDTSNGAWVPSTGIFTAPVAGWYLLSAQFIYASVAWSAGQQLACAIYVNGTQVLATLETVNAAVTQELNTGMVASPTYLNAGDTVTFRAFQGTASALALATGPGISAFNTCAALLIA